ncbi:hypothetical protein ANCCEY_03390 [Ancylostoma ceylanicum]|uniref:Uncharacterized protein n=1 Tax=Ancylostoma ceylanicum TaxID=53326 RepID=A0A0D6M238_9BILA|nr:hypothetical protein ANCCEY_03390 [Ancylostoma ceylanicum]
MILSSMLALILLCSVALCGVASPVVQEQAASELVTILETHLLQTFSGMKTEAYMTPQPKSSKTGAQQFDEMYGGLRNSYINILSIWVQQYGLGVGVYTNVYEWNEITGGATADNVLLWYWNVYGAGTSNESPATFSDFHSFAGWTVPTAKQYGQVGSVCGVDVNK